MNSQHQVTEQEAYVGKWVEYSEKENIQPDKNANWNFEIDFGIRLPKTHYIVKNHETLTRNGGPFQIRVNQKEEEII